MSWSEFKEYIYRAIRRRFPRRLGWRVEPKKALKSGDVVDWVVYMGNERGVIEAKDKAALTLDDLTRVASHRRGYRAELAIIYVASDTRVPEEVGAKADDLGIKIQRTRWKR